MEGVRALAANNPAAFDKAMTEVDRLAKLIESDEQRSNPSLGSRMSISDPGHKRAAIFNKWIREGFDGIDKTEKRNLEFRDVSEGNVLQHVGTYAGLGYLVPTGFSNQIEQALKYYAPLMDGVFGSLDTATGNPVPYPTSDDTSNTAQLVGEAGVITEEDITASHVVFGAYKFSSGAIKASVELLQDSFFDIESWLADRFGERYGRAMEYYLTQGEGQPSGEPTGLLTYIASTPAVPIIAAGSSESTGGSQTGVNSIGYSDLVNLEHSVDPSYRRGAKVGYMFHDQTLSALKRIIDKFGRPLWTPGIAVAEPDRLNSYPYTINQQFPQIGASNVTVAFGDFSKFLVRKVSGWSVQRLDQNYALNGQIGYVSWMRVDSNGIVPSGKAMNVLMQHS